MQSSSSHSQVLSLYSTTHSTATQICGFNWFKSYQEAYLRLPNAVKIFSTLSEDAKDISARFYPSLAAWPLSANGTSSVFAMYEKRRITANSAVDVIVKNVATEMTTCSSACLAAIDLIDTKQATRYLRPELLEMWKMPTWKNLATSNWKPLWNSSIDVELANALKTAIRARCVAVLSCGPGLQLSGGRT